MFTTIVFVVGTLVAVLLIDLFPNLANYISGTLVILVIVSILITIVKDELKKGKHHEE